MIITGTRGTVEIQKDKITQGKVEINFDLNPTPSCVRFYIESLIGKTETDYSSIINLIRYGKEKT